MKKRKTRSRKYPNVYSLVCSITGKTVKTTPMAFTKAWKKSKLPRKKFIKTYVSREGQRIQNNPENKQEEKIPSKAQIKDYCNKLTTDQKARWYALMLAIDEIEQSCRAKKVNFNNLEISPIPIKHYINEKFYQIKNDLEKIEA